MLRDGRLYSVTECLTVVREFCEMQTQYNYKTHLVGSLRRRLQQFDARRGTFYAHRNALATGVRDINLLLEAPKPEAVMGMCAELFGMRGGAVGELQTRFAGRLRGFPIRVTVYKSNFPAAALLHETGPVSYVRVLRDLAHLQGFRLSSDGLFQRNGGAWVRDFVEKPVNVCLRLGVVYLEPHLRDDHRQVVNSVLREDDTRPRRDILARRYPGLIVT